MSADHAMSATSHRWVALLRGVNVGRANRIAMADLRALVEALGGLDAPTLLTSGSVVFDRPEADARPLRAALEMARSAPGSSRHWFETHQ